MRGSKRKYERNNEGKRRGKEVMMIMVIIKRKYKS